jgi:hypothetical protein
MHTLCILQDALSLLSLLCFCWSFGNGFPHRNFVSFRVARLYWPATVLQITRRCYATSCNSGVSYAPTRGDCLTTASDSDWSVCMQTPSRFLSKLSARILLKEVMLRPTVSRLVYLGVKHPSRAQYKIFDTMRPVRVCWYGGPCSDSPDVTSARTEQKKQFLSRCRWRGITCFIIVPLSSWRRTAWQHRFPQLSYCYVTSPM